MCNMQTKIPRTRTGLTVFTFVIVFALPAIAFGQLDDTRRDHVETIGDRLSIWGHPTGVYNTSYLKNFPPSKIEPVDAARLMGVPNMYFIRYEGNPTIPFAAYYQPFKKLDRVMWSLTGAAGATTEEEARFRVSIGGGK